MRSRRPRSPSRCARIFAPPRTCACCWPRSWASISTRQRRVSRRRRRARASMPYDTLIVAGGSHYSYFGHDEWQEHAPELKSLEGALAIRRRILQRLRGRRDSRPTRSAGELLTFVVVGAGPTGVEMAGQIAELARDAARRLPRDRSRATARILLVETADRVLTTLPAVALGQGRALAREPRRHAAARPHRGRHRRPTVSRSRTPTSSQERIPTRTVIWAAGVTASPLAAQLAEPPGRTSTGPGVSPWSPT